MQKIRSDEGSGRYSSMFAAMGNDARLHIMRLLLSAHPQGLTVSEIQAELDIPSSTLSHHLEKLRTENLVQVRREGLFLRHTANVQALQGILAFLFAECCTRNRAIQPEAILACCRIKGKL